MSFILYAEKNQLVREVREPITSGSVNAYTVQFRFSGDWDDLTKTAVFRVGTDGQPVNVPLEADNQCLIPWEVLERSGVKLYAGVYGTNDTDMVLPTIWAELGTILHGAELGTGAQSPASGGDEIVLIPGPPGPPGPEPTIETVTENEFNGLTPEEINSGMLESTLTGSLKRIGQLL